MPVRPVPPRALLAIDGDRRALQIALVADRDGNLFVG